MYVYSGKQNTKQQSVDYIKAVQLSLKSLAANRDQLFITAGSL